jgi:rRNA maturation endonuclease Nob1
MWTVRVIDSSALIRIKHDYPAGEQWRLCERIKQQVVTGRAAFPKQVHREVAKVPHPDAPGAMIDALHQDHHIQFAEPSDETVAEVLGLNPHLHDWDAQQDMADAYVVAMALELERSQGLHAIVVSHDRVDRPQRTSVATACASVGLACESLPEWMANASEPDPITYDEWLESMDPQLQFNLGETD